MSVLRRLLRAIDHDDFFTRRSHISNDLHAGLAHAAYDGVALHSARQRGPEIMAYRADNNTHSRKKRADQQYYFRTHLTEKQQQRTGPSRIDRRLVPSEQDFKGRGQPATPIARTHVGLSERKRFQDNHNQACDYDWEKIAGFEHQSVA